MTSPLLVRVARGGTYERVPVWCMRQAGRSLPEYNKLKGGTPFMAAIRDVKLATELTMQPVRRYGVDGAVVYSDILTIPQAMGIKISIDAGVIVHNPLTEDSDLTTALQDFDADQLNFVYEIVGNVKQTLINESLPDVAVIGFSGAPWTLLTYMLGDLSKDKHVTRRFATREPAKTATLLRLLENAIIEYLDRQIQAGAHVVQLFDSWAGSVALEPLREFVVPGYKYIIESLRSRHPDTPILLFAKGVDVHELSSVPASVFGIDERVDPVLLPENLILQGNLDPCVLYGDSESVRAATMRMKARFRGRPWIANLGHGVPKDVDPDMVQVMIDTIRTPQRIIRVGTRGSPLAMMQARFVTRFLCDRYPSQRFEIDIITTKGDENQEAWLHELGATDSSFAKELEHALQMNRIDIAVHSLKDMESTVPADLCLAAITEREDPSDVLVSPKYASIGEMPPGSIVGTTSLRRQSQIQRHYPVVEIQKCRGTIETRLRKSAEAPYAGVVMAAAGLKRMNKFTRRDVHTLGIDEYAVGQGCLGIECRARDQDIIDMCRGLDHAPSSARCLAERAMLAAINGGCGTPVSVRSEYYPEDGRVSLNGTLYQPNEDEARWRSHSVSGRDPVAVGVAVAAELTDLSGRSDSDRECRSI